MGIKLIFWCLLCKKNSATILIREVKDFNFVSDFEYEVNWLILDCYKMTIRFGCFFSFATCFESEFDVSSNHSKLKKIFDEMKVQKKSFCLSNLRRFKGGWKNAIT